MHSSVVFLLRNSKKMTTGSWSKFFTLHANIRAYLFWPPVKQIFRTHKPSHHITTFNLYVNVAVVFFRHSFTCTLFAVYDCFPLFTFQPIFEVFRSFQATLKRPFLSTFLPYTVSSCHQFGTRYFQYLF